MALSTTTNGDISSQSNTQSPQLSAGSGSAPTAAAKSVQPGTATSLLSGAAGGSEGIPLNSTILPIANLNTSAQTTSITQPKDTAGTKQHHHPNAVLLIIVAILVVFAIATMWLTHQSAKNTTEY
ncbi:MAG TPA: hypothetical protein VHA05_01970 [Candidatus Saccharimonadales bacterium]|nr:hypothetical protein [Candidatus Saccharimonadales bacterium]